METEFIFTGKLQTVAKEWLLLEMSHNVSKTASDMFWEVAKKLFHGLVEEKMKCKKNKKIPTFTHIRRVLVSRNCPEIHLDLAYKTKATGEIVRLNDLQKIPVNEYKRSLYEPLYEIASIQVNMPYSVIYLSLIHI